jgi:hypothetical protein
MPQITKILPVPKVCYAPKKSHQTISYIYIKV